MKLNRKLDGLQKELERHNECLTSLEDNVASLHQRLAKVTSCATLQTKNKKLESNLTDLEGIKVQSNALLVGLPEEIEVPQPSKSFVPGPGTDRGWSSFASIYTRIKSTFWHAAKFQLCAEG